MALSASAVLCNCTGYYANRISWEKVQAAVSPIPALSFTYVDEQFCSEESQKRFRRRIAEVNPARGVNSPIHVNPGTGAFIVAACAAQEAVFRKSIESQIKGPHRLHVIKMVELCREYPDEKSATDALIGLLRKMAQQKPLSPREVQWVTTHPGRESV